MVRLKMASDDLRIESYLDDQVPELTRKMKGKPQYPYTFSRGSGFSCGDRSALIREIYCICRLFSFNFT